MNEPDRHPWKIPWQSRMVDTFVPYRQFVGQFAEGPVEFAGVVDELGRPIVRNAREEAEVTPEEEFEEMLDIRFYRANETPYGFLSNLYRYEFEFEGRVYQTAEHAYQARKARREVVREWLLAAPSPSLLAMAAHALPVWEVAADWADVKVGHMRNVLRAKFRGFPLRTSLLDTGRHRLVETGTTNNAVNRFWGEVNGKGENTLGRLLMEIRAELLEEEAALAEEDERAAAAEIAAEGEGSTWNVN